MLGQQEQFRSAMLTDKLLLIDLIDKLLSEILTDTRNLQKGSSPFHCKDVPSISLGNYLKRIAKFANCSNSIFVLSLIYIDRIQEASEHLVLNHFCVHRLVITTVMVAAKYAQDFYYKNQYYAKVGGISRTEINALQVQLLTTLNYHLHVGEIQFNNYLEKLEAYRDVNQKLTGEHLQ